jgi:hypothetical protein
MAHNCFMSETSVDAMADRLAQLANNGFLRIYDGAQPASSDDAITDQKQLCELLLGNPAFGAASGGTITAHPITADPDADDTGTASWFRIYESDGTTALWDGSVGESNCDININSVAIQQHANVSLTAFSHTLSK